MTRYLLRRAGLLAGVSLAVALALAGCAPAIPTTLPVVPTAAVLPTAGLPAGSVHLNGAGATFPLPVYSEWTYAYQFVDPSVIISYNSIGSGGGKQAIISNTVDFGASDSLLTDAEYTAGKDLQMYPMVAGAVVPIYNLEGNNAALVLDRATLAGIYAGKIRKWSDPALAQLNPKVTFPDKPITVVHRSDGSGTTELFTRALSAFSPDWTAGFGSSVKWPADALGSGVGAAKNQGVAAAVQAAPDSIGYVELNYALANSLPTAQMVNKAGETVVANSNSLHAAMDDFAGGFTDKLTNTIVDAPGAASWPIAGYSYLILHTTNMTDCLKASKLVAFMRWALTDPAAAQRAAALGYSVLPDTVRQKVLVKLSGVSCEGKPVQ
jgi:phosphate transport system substrate-binding protein